MSRNSAEAVNPSNTQDKFPIANRRVELPTARSKEQAVAAITTVSASVQGSGQKPKEFFSDGTNQDAVNHITAVDGTVHVAALADGVSSAHYSAKGARLAVDVFTTQLAKKLNLGQPLASLWREMAASLNHQLRDKKRQSGLFVQEDAFVSTELVVGVYYDRKSDEIKLQCMNIGDCRLYSLRFDQFNKPIISCLTLDQSQITARLQRENGFGRETTLLLQSLMSRRRAELTPAEQVKYDAWLPLWQEAAVDSNKITNFFPVITHDDVFDDSAAGQMATDNTFTLTIEPGTILLGMTDGVYQPLIARYGEQYMADEIARYLAQGKSLQFALSRLATDGEEIKLDDATAFGMIIPNVTERVTSVDMPASLATASAVTMNNHTRLVLQGNPNPNLTQSSIKPKYRWRATNTTLDHQEKKSRLTLQFNVGDDVRVIQGEQYGMEGTVIDIDDQGMVSVEVRTGVLFKKVTTIQVSQDHLRAKNSNL